MTYINIQYNYIYYIFYILLVCILYTYRGVTSGSVVKNLPAAQEMRVQSLGWEDPLEKSVATLSSILAGKIPLTERPGGLKSLGLQRVGHN